MASLVGLAGCATMSADQRKLDVELRHKQAPDFELTALDGPKVKLSDFRGKPVVLAFWGFG
ncbi:MAG: redoxin domain-containing protein [Planctomycetes bacterium]|nr:redoxin domain-containing protein [Planctomycetota bacterium]MBI3834379.1 redoxin domain-containing protein [Planctomycetota bacterium]